MNRLSETDLIGACIQAVRSRGLNAPRHHRRRQFKLPPQAPEAIWKHIHKGGMQRPGDLRIIYADEKLLAVAGTDVITMYALEDLIRPHLKPIK